MFWYIFDQLSTYSQVSIKRAGYIKQAGRNIFKKEISEQAELSKLAGLFTKNS